MSIRRHWFAVTVFAVALAPLIAIAAGGGENATVANAKGASIMMVSEGQPELIARAEGPITLGPAPVSVNLLGARGVTAGTLSASVRELAPGQRIYLVVRNAHADAPPGVIYHIYLDLPPATHPARDDPHYVGALNFYAFTNPAGPGSGRFRSFDITQAAIDLERRNLLTADTTIMIVPASSPNARANATIGQIELARQ
jgi:hypothetical protein